MQRKEKAVRVEDLDVDDVMSLLARWGLQEFVELARERRIDGRTLLEITEGIVKLRCPKANAKKLILFIQELKLNPSKYLETIRNDQNGTDNDKSIIEVQYQTVNMKKKTEHISISTVSGVEEILKRIVPPKSFLYRNHPPKADKPTSSYVPMDAGTPKKPRRFFQLSSYEYPHFDQKHKRLSKTEHFNDRGYYSIKTNSRFYMQKIYKKPESRTKYKSLSMAEELDKSDDHFYEDLNYSEIQKDNNDIKETNVNHTVKPYKIKIQELFQSLKIPFFKKNEEVEGEKRLEDCKLEEKDKYTHIYENNDSTTSMYDSVHVNLQETKPDNAKKINKEPILIQSYKLPFFKNNKEVEEDRKLESNKSTREEKDRHIYENSDSISSMYDSVHVSTQENKPDNVENKQLPVEDYLEPVRVCKDYCDVTFRHRDDSLLGYIMSIFEHRFGIRRETSDDDANQPEDLEDNKAGCTLEALTDAEGRKCMNERKRTNMADRPLPVPVENEPYYMSIDRSEAENLLRGQPDGTFVLRPSSQPNHAYTLTVSCSSAVHNVGVRRRADGRLALGFARRGERSFASIASLLRHHRRRRLLLVAGGRVCGATTLHESPEYYQTPSNLPLPL